MPRGSGPRPDPLMISNPDFVLRKLWGSEGRLNKAAGKGKKGSGVVLSERITFLLCSIRVAQYIFHTVQNTKEPRTLFGYLYLLKSIREKITNKQNYKSTNFCNVSKKLF